MSVASSTRNQKHLAIFTVCLHGTSTYTEASFIHAMAYIHTMASIHTATAFIPAAIASIHNAAKKCRLFSVSLVNPLTSGRKPGMTCAVSTQGLLCMGPDRLTCIVFLCFVD